jgi:HSP20 family protein
VNVKDADGNTVSQRLEVVTTPFAKEDVKVSVDDNVLSVECGSENKEEKSGDEYIYKGISSQSYTFAIKLSDRVDKTGIKAKNVDGVLTVTLPFKKDDEPKKITSIEVE